MAPISMNEIVATIARFGVEWKEELVVKMVESAKALVHSKLVLRF